MDTGWKPEESVITFVDQTLAERKKQWQQPELKVKFGVLYKYAKQVSSASKGCLTDL